MKDYKTLQFATTVNPVEVSVNFFIPLGNMRKPHIFDVFRGA